MDEIARRAIAHDFAADIGLQLKLARVARRMSIRDLSEITGITSAAISRIENGQTDVKLSSLALIRSALALDVSIKPL